MSAGVPGPDQGGGCVGVPGGRSVPLHGDQRRGAVWGQERRQPGPRRLHPVQPHLTHGTHCRYTGCSKKVIL